MALKLIECLSKTDILPKEVKRAIVRKTRGYIKEGMQPITASKQAINEHLSIVQEDLARVQETLKAVSAPMRPVRESALGFGGSWRSTLFNHNASSEAQAKAAGELMQDVTPTESLNATEVKPLTPEQAQLVADNLDVPGSLAKKFDNIPGTSYAERNSEARMGLIKAAQGFDVSRLEPGSDVNKVFRNYARQSIGNTLRDLFKNKVKQSSKEVSANVSIDEEGLETFQDLIEAPEEKQLPDQRAIDIINNVRATLSPRDQAILNDYAGGLVLRDVAELHKMSHEGVRKIIKTSGQKIVQALADAGITDVESIFPPQEQRTQVIASEKVTPEDENADTSEIVGQLEAQDIQRQEPLLSEDEDVVAPMSPRGQRVRVPWREVKEGPYRPGGKLSPAGLWSKDLFSMLKRKNQKIRAIGADAAMTVNRLKSEIGKQFKDVPVPIAAIDMAFGNADNKLTPEQTEALKGLRTPPLTKPASLVAAEQAFSQDQSKVNGDTLNKETIAFEKSKVTAREQMQQGFIQTARLDNIANIKQQMSAALLSLPDSIQSIITEMRDMVDLLSKELIKNGDISDDLKFTIDNNLGVYMTRSYAIFDGDEWAKRMKKAEDPETQQIRNKVEALFTAEERAKAAIKWAQDQKATGTPVTKAEARAHVADFDVSDLVSNTMEDYLSVADGSVVDLIQGRLPGQQNRKVLKLRGEIPEEIRAYWGEYKNASVNFAKTYVSIATFLANRKFLTDVLADGVANGYIWKEGMPGSRAGMVELVGSESAESMSPLAGAWGPPELRDAFNDLKKQPTKTWFDSLTLMAMMAQTVYSVQAVSRNFYGNIQFVIGNGNLFLGDFRNAKDMMWANLKQLGTRDQQKRVVRYQELGILEDNVGPSMIKELAAHSKEFMGMTPDEIWPKMVSKVYEKAKLIPSGFQKAYSGVDNFWKIYQFEAELTKLKWAEPNTPIDQLENRAADITRSNTPTYSEISQIIRNIFQGHGAGRFVAPFISFTTEVIRIGYNTPKRAISELSSSNPKMKAIGAARLAGFGIALMGPSVVSRATKMAFGYDDDDEEAIRRELPEWQKDATLWFLQKKDGKPSFVDISYLTPYNYLIDPFKAISRAIRNKGQEPVEKTAIKAGVGAAKRLVEPFVSEQLFLGAVADIARNKTASGGEVYNEKDTWADISLKSSGHIFQLLLPATIARTGVRIAKAGIGYVEPSGRSYDLLSEVAAPITGQRIITQDPAQAFKFQVKRFGEDRNNSAQLFSEIARSEGTVDSGDITRAYMNANRAAKESAQDLRDDYLAVTKLGIPKDRAMGIMKAGRAGESSIAQAVSGVYKKYTPGPALLKEMQREHPERYQEFLKAYNSVPAVEKFDR